MSYEAILRLGLLIGGLVDLVFGAANLIAWQWFLSLLRVPLPPHPAFVQLAALLSIAVAMMVFIAWRAPRRYTSNITVATLLRFATAALLLLLIRQGHLPPHIVALAAGEALLGVLHLLYWRRLATSKE